VDTARRIFAVKTEKEAVNKALEMVIIDDQIIEAHSSVASKGDVIEDAFR
jgi:Arc/MetJ family transcription regulator